MPPVDLIAGRSSSVTSGPRVALITGITGQDGSYLAEVLLGKGYTVHGIKRRSSSLNTNRVDHLYRDPQESSRFRLHYGDLTDGSSLARLIQEIRPHEIYNLGAQSHVGVSFEAPEYTIETDTIGTLRLLEAVRLLGAPARIYQASSSEMYGNSTEAPQNEGTKFQPCSPYGIAKLAAYWLTVAYRKAYGIHVSNGILFNHESPRRGETFVSRKITRAAARIEKGMQSTLYLGNLDARRDWGHARDYVQAMWLMLQQPRPDDYVIATGVSRSVREFAEAAFSKVGITLLWTGRGVAEKGIDAETGRVLVAVDPRYFRPAELGSLLGDAGKASDVLGWKPRVTFDTMVAEMVQFDRWMAQGEKLLRDANAESVA